jgi:hypothetical protein
MEQLMVFPELLTLVVVVRLLIHLGVLVDLVLLLFVIKYNIHFKN